MRYFIISDLHANLEAKDAIEKHMRERFHPEFANQNSNDMLVFLGDGIGYGPNPNEVFEWLHANAQIWTLGDHEIMINLVQKDLHSIDWSRWSPLAAASWIWTANNLSQGNAVILDELVAKGAYKAHVNEILFTHAHPACSLHSWEYVIGLQSSLNAFTSSEIKERIMFSGHTHNTQFYVDKGKRIRGGFVDFGIEDNSIIKSTRDEEPNTPVLWKSTNWKPSMSKDPLIKKVILNPKQRYLISCPSAGQPRDGITNTGYIVYDSNSRKLVICSVPYDHQKTMKKIPDAGLPESLATRLEIGR